MTPNQSLFEIIGAVDTAAMTKNACDSLFNVKYAIDALIDSTNKGITVIEVDKVKKRFTTKNAYKITDTVLKV